MWFLLMCYKASGIFLHSCDFSVLSNGQPWSVPMKFKQAVAHSKKVMLLVAAEESGAVPVGGALHVFTSNSPFIFKLKNWRGWKEGRRKKNKSKSKLLDQRSRG